MALPGGLGTFDEECDVACQKQLGMNCDKVNVEFNVQIIKG